MDDSSRMCLRKLGYQITFIMYFYILYSQYFWPQFFDLWLCSSWYPRSVVRTPNKHHLLIQNFTSLSSLYIMKITQHLFPLCTSYLLYTWRLWNRAALLLAAKPAQDKLIISLCCPQFDQIYTVVCIHREAVWTELSLDSRIRWH